MKVQLTWKDNSTNETGQEIKVQFRSNGVDNTPEDVTVSVEPNVESAEIDLPQSTKHLCEITVTARNAISSAESSDKFVTSTQFPDQFLLSQLTSSIGTAIKETVNQNPDAAARTVADYNSDFNDSSSCCAQRPDGSIYSLTANRVRKYDKDFVPTTVVDPLAYHAVSSPTAISSDGIVYTIGRRSDFAEVFAHKGEQFESLLELNAEQTHICSGGSRGKLSTALLDGSPVWVVYGRDRDENGVFHNRWTFFVVDVQAKTISSFNYANVGDILLGEIGVLDTGEVWTRVNETNASSSESYYLIIDFTTKQVREVKADKPYPFVKGTKTVTVGKKIVLTGQTYDENYDQTDVIVVVDLSSKDSFSAKYTDLTQVSWGGTVSNPVSLPSGRVVCTLCDESGRKLELVTFDIADNAVKHYVTHHEYMGHRLLVRHGNSLRAIAPHSGDHYVLPFEQPNGVALDSRFTSNNVGCGLPSLTMGF